MLSVKNAESLILNLVSPIPDTETVSLEQSLGRILAIDITGEHDFPFWDNAAMDGYAVKFQDCHSSGSLTIANRILAAGDSYPYSLKSGEAVAILTGAPLPLGADTVIMQEDVEAIGNQLYLKNKPECGQYIRHRGEFYQVNKTLLKAGIKINPPEIGILAAFGKRQLQVRRQPKVGIISTGNELQEISRTLNYGQIFDSNQYVLSALIKNCGGIPLKFGAVGDQLDLLSQTINLAIDECDLVISSGGASVGDRDLVKAALNNLQAHLQITSCRIKPGKPLKVATLHGKLYIGLPGNPASAMVSFHRFIKGAIYKLSGANSNYWYPTFSKAVTTQDLHSDGRRETYLWGKLQSNLYYQPASNHSSGNLVSWAEADCLAILKVYQTYVPALDTVEILMICNK